MPSLTHYNIISRPVSALANGWRRVILIYVGGICRRRGYESGDVQSPNFEMLCLTMCCLVGETRHFLCFSVCNAQDKNPRTKRES